MPRISEEDESDNYGRKSATDTGWILDYRYHNYYRQTWEGGEWRTTWRDLGPRFRVEESSFYVPGRIFACLFHEEGEMPETLSFLQCLVLQGPDHNQRCNVILLQTTLIGKGRDPPVNALSVKELDEVYGQPRKYQKIKLNLAAPHTFSQTHYDIIGIFSDKGIIGVETVVMDIGQVVDNDLEKLTRSAEEEVTVRFSTDL